MHSITQILNKIIYCPSTTKKTMANSETTNWRIQNQLIRLNQLHETSVSNQLKDKHCALMQIKDIFGAFKQLLDIINGNTRKPRKSTTSRRPHLASHRGTQPHSSLTHNTCSSMHSLRNLTPITYQINHITHRTPYSNQVGRLLADTTSDGHISFHTTLK